MTRSSDQIYRYHQSTADMNSTFIASDNSSAATMATSINSQTIYNTTSAANFNTPCDFEFSQKFEEWLKVFFSRF